MYLKAFVILIWLSQVCVLLTSARSLWEPDVSSEDLTVAPAKRTGDGSEQPTKEQQEFADAQIKHAFWSDRRRDTPQDREIPPSEDTSQRTAKEREEFAAEQIRYAVYSNRKRDPLEEQEKAIGRGGFGGLFGGRGPGGSGGLGGKGGKGGRGGKGGKGDHHQPHHSDRPPPYSAVPRTYGGGRYYGGGAIRPYAAGAPSPFGLLPFIFLPLAALSFFPGPWMHGGFLYHGAPYHVHNDTDDKDVPVTCICQKDSQCGCEDNNNKTYIDSVLKEKRPDGLPQNSSIVKVATVNGTEGIYINGTIAADDKHKKSAASREYQVYYLQGGGYLLLTMMVCAFVLSV